MPEITTLTNPTVDFPVTVAYYDGEAVATIHADGQRLGVSAVADFEGADLCGAMHAALAANGFNVYSVDAIEPDDDGIRWIPSPRPEAEIERLSDGTVCVVEGLLGGHLAVVDDVPADWRDLGRLATGQRLIARPLTAVYETAERTLTVRPEADDLGDWDAEADAELAAFKAAEAEAEAARPASSEQLAEMAAKAAAYRAAMTPTKKFDRAYVWAGILISDADHDIIVVANDQDDFTQDPRPYGFGFRALGDRIREAGERSPILRLIAGLKCATERTPPHVGVTISEPLVVKATGGYRDLDRYHCVEVVSTEGAWAHGRRQVLVAGVLPVHETGSGRLEPGHAFLERADEHVQAGVSYGILVRVTSDTGEATTWRFVPGTVAYRTMCEWLWAVVRDRMVFRAINGSEVYDYDEGAGTLAPDGYGDQCHPRSGDLWVGLVD